MKDYTIKVQTDQVQDAFVKFVDNYKGNIAQYLNGLMKADGLPVDSAIVVDINGISVYQLAPDKGFILGEVSHGIEGDLPIKLMKYSELDNELKYLVQENDRLVLYLKREEGEPDVLLGAFKTITDAVTGFDSEPVRNTLVELKRMEKEEKSDKFRNERKAKLGKAPSMVQE